MAVVVALLAALRFARETVHESGELLANARVTTRGPLRAASRTRWRFYSLLLAYPVGALEADATLLPARAQLRAHIAAADEPLPACDALLAVDRSSHPKIKADAPEAAIDEIGMRLGV